MKMQVSRVEGAWQWCRAVVVCLGAFDGRAWSDGHRCLWRQGGPGRLVLFFYFIFFLSGSCSVTSGRGWC